MARKKEEPNKKNSNVDSKEQEGENGNLDSPFEAIPARRADEQVPDRRGNGWFNVGPGVQEIGDELNHIRLAGYVFIFYIYKKKNELVFTWKIYFLNEFFSIDGGGERVDVGDDQYEGVEYDKEPQQKDSDLRLVEGEDEGEGIYCIINYVNIYYFKSVIYIYCVFCLFS